MFTLTPLAVALQGIGYATLLVSLQGLVAVTIAPDDAEDVTSGLSVAPPRRKVRRWRSLANVPNPYEMLLKQRQNEQALLAALDVI